MIAVALKAFFSRAFSVPYSGLKSVDSCLASAISHYEGLHCNFVCLLYSKLINHLPEECVINIISSAVDIKMELVVVDALPVKLIGINSTMMCNHIKFCADPNS